MKYKQGMYPIISSKTLAKEVYDWEIYCPRIAAHTEPGQFVTLLPKGFPLRRPISICGMDKEKGTLRLVFEVRGKGTKALSLMKEGDLVDMMAPLGRGFRVGQYQSAIILGGGIGTPPMVPMAQHFGEKARVITGFRNAAAVILAEDFKKAGASLTLCTDDGSAGFKGLVTVPLREELEKEKSDVILACGPGPMIRGVVELAKEYGVPCQISMEERMGCGIGACLVCACRVVRGGSEYYAHVCQDGPVFDSKEVLF